MTKQLKSKKNQVLLTDIGLGNHHHAQYVVKNFATVEAFEREVSIYKELQGSALLIPHIVAKEGDAQLVLTYIEGQTALEKLEALDTMDPKSGLWQRESAFFIENLCGWIAQFYKIMYDRKKVQWILGDIHLRNFIFEKDGGTVYGIDFEECTMGQWESDMARLSVFILTYDPAYTENKVKLCRLFMKKMGALLDPVSPLDQKFLKEELYRELEDLGKRRGVEVEKNVLKEMVEDV
ncbi:MAG: phosphotransferase [Anaerovorax sp.]